MWREAATPEGQRGYSLSPRRCYLQRRCSVNTRCPTQRASVAPSAEVQDGALLAICESLTILISERSRKEISFPSQAPRDGMLAPSEHASIATVTLDDKRREDEQRGKPLRALARSHGLAAAPDGAPKGAPAVTQELGPASDVDHSGRKAGSPGLGAAEDTGASSRRGYDAPQRARGPQRRGDGAGRCHAPSGPKARRPNNSAGQSRAATEGCGDRLSSPHHERKGRLR